MIMEQFDRWRNMKKEYRYFIIIAMISIFIGGFFLLYVVRTKPKQEESPILMADNSEKQNTIQVDIKGAVVKPGVYELSENSNVKEVIEKSGGLTEYADTSYINLSKHLKDEMVIIIYSKDEITAMKDGQQNVVVVEGKCVCPNITNDGCLDAKNMVDNTRPQQSNTGMVNLNTATLEELQSLTGIGLSKAKDIIAYREQNGGFESIEEITQVKGIGNATFEKIKDRITTS